MNEEKMDNFVYRSKYRLNITIYYRMNALFEKLKMRLKNSTLYNLIGGGLVLGATHRNGGICLVCIDDIKISVVANMEGCEYVVNPIATKRFYDRLNEINSFNETVDVTTLPNIPITCINIEKGNAGIMTADQFIINRNATIKYISELQEINNYGQDRLGGYNSESVKYRELSKLIKSINEKDATYLGKY